MYINLDCFLFFFNMGLLIAWLRPKARRHRKVRYYKFGTQVNASVLSNRPCSRFYIGV